MPDNHTYYLLREYERDIIKALFPVDIFLSIVLVVGIIGNTFVIFMFATKMRKYKKRSTVFHSNFGAKLRRVKDTPNFISSGSKIVKRLRRRQNDPLIIKRNIGILLDPCTALYRLFLENCTLTNKTVGAI